MLSFSDVYLFIIAPKLNYKLFLKAIICYFPFLSPTLISAYCKNAWVKKTTKPCKNFKVIQESVIIKIVSTFLGNHIKENPSGAWNCSYRNA